MERGHGQDKKRYDQSFSSALSSWGVDLGRGRLAGSVGMEHVTLDLGVVSSSLTLDVEIT